MDSGYPRRRLWHTVLRARLSSYSGPRRGSEMNGGGARMKHPLEPPQLSIEFVKSDDDGHPAEDERSRNEINHAALAAEGTTNGNRKKRSE